MDKVLGGTNHGELVGQNRRLHGPVGRKRDDVGAAKRHAPRNLWESDLVTDHDADASDRSVEHRQVVVGRLVGEPVTLAMNADQTVGAGENGAVVDAVALPLQQPDDRVDVLASALGEEGRHLRPVDVESSGKSVRSRVEHVAGKCTLREDD